MFRSRLLLAAPVALAACAGADMGTVDLAGTTDDCVVAENEDLRPALRSDGGVRLVCSETPPPTALGTTIGE